MNPRLVSLVRLFAVPLAFLAAATAVRAQLMIQGNIEARFSSLTTAGGAVATAKYATTPPGYTSPGAINQTGSGVFSSALSLEARKGTGAATLLYKPSSGTANALSAFGGIQSGDTFSLGSLQLSDTTLPSSGSVSFLWSVAFGSLQVFDGATPLTPVFANVPILDIPLTLSLNSAGSRARLALAAPFNAATMFHDEIDLGSGYRLELSPATTFETLIGTLSSPGAFQATPNSAKSFGTIDLTATVFTPVPEPSTYALGGAVLMIGLVALQRFRRRPTSACSPAI